MGYEEILERALRAALQDVDLEDVAEVEAVEPLVDGDGAPVEIDDVATLADGGFLTENRGVVVRLSDGAEFTVDIKAYRPPHGGWRA